MPARSPRAERCDPRAYLWTSDGAVVSTCMRGLLGQSVVNGASAPGASGITVVIRGYQRSSEVIRGHPRSSEVIRGHPRSSKVIRGHQRPSEAIRGHQRSSERTWRLRHRGGRAHRRQRDDQIDVRTRPHQARGKGAEGLHLRPWPQESHHGAHLWETRSAVVSTCMPRESERGASW